MSPPPATQPGPTPASPEPSIPVPALRFPIPDPHNRVFIGPRRRRYSYRYRNADYDRSRSKRAIYIWWRDPAAITVGFVLVLVVQWVFGYFYREAET